MSEQELRERIYKLIVELREMGLTYDEIEEFWDECIKEVKKQNETKNRRNKSVAKP